MWFIYSVGSPFLTEQRAIVFHTHRQFKFAPSVHVRYSLSEQTHDPMRGTIGIFPRGSHIQRAAL